MAKAFLFYHFPLYYASAYTHLRKSAYNKEWEVGRCW